MWERKPHPNPAFKHPKEDLFLCPACKDYFPWYRFCKGKCLIVGYDEPTYESMTKEKELRWACDTCVDKLVTQHIRF